MKRTGQVGLVMGIGGILLVVVYLVINHLSVEGPYDLQQLLDNPLVQIVGTIAFFMGGEVAVAVATVLTAREKGQAGIGVAAALLGMLLVLLVFALRPGLVPSYGMAFAGPIAFLGFLMLPSPLPPVIRKSAGS